MLAKGTNELITLKKITVLVQLKVISLRHK